MRKITFENEAFVELSEWATENKKAFDRIIKLIQESSKTPFTGTGKPEVLKHNYKGYWSRRITGEHRLIYKVTDDAIIIAGCKHHYDDK